MGDTKCNKVYPGGSPNFRETEALQYFWTSICTSAIVRDHENERKNNSLNNFLHPSFASSFLCPSAAAARPAGVRPSTQNIEKDRCLNETTKELDAFSERIAPALYRIVPHCTSLYPHCTALYRWKFKGFSTNRANGAATDPKRDPLRALCPSG